MRAMLLGLALLAGTSQATTVEKGHDTPAAGEHGAAAAPQGGEHGGHVTVTGDDDHDGTANWMDSDSEAYSVVKLSSQAISLLIVLGVLFTYGRPAISDFVRNRALATRKLLVDSAQAQIDAKKSFDSLDARLASIEAEITRIAADAESEAAGEEAKLIARAQEEGQRIGTVAERKIRDEVNRARMALRTEAVELAVKLAESTLRGSIGPADQQRLAREFLESLKKGEVGLHG